MKTIVQNGTSSLSQALHTPECCYHCFRLRKGQIKNLVYMQCKFNKFLKFYKYNFYLHLVPSYIEWVQLALMLFLSLSLISYPYLLMNLCSLFLQNVFWKWGIHNYKHCLLLRNSGYLSIYLWETLLIGYYLQLLDFSWIELQFNLCIYIVHVIVQCICLHQNYMCQVKILQKILPKSYKILPRSLLLMFVKVDRPSSSILYR